MGNPLVKLHYGMTEPMVGQQTLFDHTIQNGGLKRLEVLQRNKLN